jgi:hypothetical protein
VIFAGALTPPICDWHHDVPVPLNTAPLLHPQCAARPSCSGVPIPQLVRSGAILLAKTRDPYPHQAPRRKTPRSAFRGSPEAAITASRRPSTPSFLDVK